MNVTLNDLTPFVPDIDPAKAAVMIADAMATATLIAPCIATPEFDNAPAARAIIRGAIIRWNEAGSGAIVTETAGPFSRTITTDKRRSLFWPSEIADLAKLCGTTPRLAFTVDTALAGGLHPAWCALLRGGYCSCGMALLG